MKIAILHPPTIANPVTELAADYLAGVSSIDVKNTAQWGINKFALIGSIGYEESELKQVNTITPPKTIALSASTAFPHNADTKVTLFDYDQIKIYRSTTGVNGTYDYMTTLSIDVSSDFTTYEETGAQVTYFYKFSYANSVAHSETDLSDPISSAGFVFHALKTLIDRTLSLFGDSQSQFVFRDEVQDYLNEFYEIAQHEMMLATKRLSIKNDTITVENGVESYPLFNDFLMEKGIKVSQDGGNTFQYKAVMQNVDHMGDIYQTNVLYGYSVVGGNIELDPVPGNSTDVLKIYYIPTPVQLLRQTDTLAAPFANRSAMFVRYALAMCYLKDKKFDEYKDLRDESTNKLKDFVSYVKRLGNLHPQFTEIMDASLM